MELGSSGFLSASSSPSAMEEKRRKHSVSSDDSDTTDSHTNSWSRCSKTPAMCTKTNWRREKEKKPSEVFRTDLITAMKIPDSQQLGSDEYYILADPWRQEWEKGVQVPAGVEAIPEPKVRVVETLEASQSTEPESDYPEVFRTTSCGPCRYDLDEVDSYWLELVNLELKNLEMPELDEPTLEKVLEELEVLCYQNMNVAIETEEGLGIEYDEDVVCDVCRSPEGEDGNEMVFCDKCNVCVHQACYGILKVPLGNWLCRTCALGVQPKCLLCPKRGGALKPTRSGTKWVHVSCALWIPECSMPFCVTAFHVTCAFDHGLEMRTILADNDEVKFKSFCLEHSGGGVPRLEDARLPRPSGSLGAPGDADPAKPDLEKVTLRKQKLQQLEEDFYELVSPSEVADNLDLSEMLVEFVFQYWKLKRKANFNQPLLSPETDEVDNLAQQEQDVLYRRLKLFTHLRQDLERVRNLCYMVTRREKMKHSICKLQEQIFQLQMKLTEKDLYPDQAGKRAKGKKSDPKRRGRESRRNSPEKERVKAGSDSVLGQLGLSTPFPIDGTFFNSWLAQSVQITTENLNTSQWSLNNGHHEDNTPKLLSEELLQDEETVLSFMMDHSLKSPFKQTDATKRVRSKARMNSKKKMSRNSLETIVKSQQEDPDQWNNRRYLADHTMKPLNHDARHKPGKGAAKPHADRKGSSDVKKAATKGLVPPPAQKANGSPASMDLRRSVSNREGAVKRAQSEPHSLVKVPDSAGSPKAAVRFKLPKESRADRESPSKKPNSAGRALPGSRPRVSLHFDQETEGYFSDAEVSDSENEGSGGERVKLGPLDSGKEDIVRMSILAS
ncbi:E3 ubiquitin-protein ligase Jade-2 isoform X2 [Rhinatrema bivittatum]|uniref:E3 ubiquitin-protein ligase Jade-2 isoform X2 n=1 Tax=Rhinatrema bivittatum TaxID=194408 RepID=UPI00112A9E32|nr:E3 ubiquitin-protein ligase Jade-2 isoform X2 [Rhinatrema bivittatum]